MSKDKQQASKRARSEAKQIDHLRYMGVKVHEKHRTSHVSGNRGRAK